MKLRAACIQARDALPLIDFYKKVFGHEPEADGGVDFRFYPEQLTIYQIGGGEGHETRGAAMIYRVEDVDAEYERLRALGLANLNPPSDKPWGLRSFMIRDPAANLISFTKEI